jgi:hypothetical protein
MLNGEILMHKIDVIYDMGLDYIFDENPKQIKVKTSKGKQVKISDEIFDFMINEGLIKKTDDGYIFVGKTKDIAKKNKKK